MGSLRHWQCCVNGTVGFLLLLSPWVALFMLAGLWLLVAPWTLGFTAGGSGAWTAWVSAAALLGLSGWALTMPDSATALALLGIVGLCLLVVPWVPPLAPARASGFCEFVPGLLVTLGSVWALASVREARSSGHPTQPKNAHA